MKKTTIRAVGFLFVAACVALLASCNQSTTPVESKKKAPPPFMAQFKGVWKVKDFMGRSFVGDEAGYFHFDKDGKLRIAYTSDTSNATNMFTRAAEVAVETEGTDKIKIAELGITEAKTFKLDDDTITITITPISRIVLTKVENADDSIKDVVFTKDTKNKNPETVVYNFNKYLLGFDAVWELERETSFKIEKLHGKEPGEKKSNTDKKEYHFSTAASADKYILTVSQEAGNNKAKEAACSVAYTLGSDKMTITVPGLNLKGVPFTAVVDSGNTTLTIGKGKTVTILKTQGATPYTGNLVNYDENDETVKKAIAAFDKKEE